MNNSDRRRLIYVDIAKGILIFLVVFGHVWRSLYHNHILNNGALFANIDSFIYGFHMPAFFFIAGIFVLGSYRGSPWSFIKSKIKTIVYPYMVWSVAQSSIQVCLAGSTTQTLGMSDILLIPFVPVMQFWFLYALFFIYLFFCCIRCFTSSITVFLVLGILLFYLTRYGLVPGIIPIVYMTNNFIYFAVGIYLSRYMLEYFGQQEGVWKISIGIVASLLCAVLTVPVLDMLTAENGALVKPFIAIPGVCFVVYVSNMVKLFGGIFSRLLAALGKVSLEIYVAHTLFAAGFRIIALRLFHINDLVFHLTGGVLFGLAGPVILVWGVRKLGLSYVFRWPARNKTV